MESPNDRLIAARRDAGYERPADAARAFGWKEPTYHGHENGSRGLTPDAVLTYARAFKVDPAWLLWGGQRGGVTAVASQDDEVTVPVYDIQASAGAGAVVDHEVVVDQLRFPPGYLRHLTSSPLRNLAIVSVKGDSMSPTLNDDDIVLLDTGKTNLGYDGLFVVEMDGTLHVKRITRGTRDGWVTVRSDNERYPPYERSLSEIRAIGKVLWTGRKE